MRMGKRIGDMQEVIIMIPISVFNKFTINNASIPNLDTMLELKMREFINEHEAEWETRY